MSCKPGMFDQSFYTSLPLPPLGILDPCYPQWLEVQRMSAERAFVCRRTGDSSEECAAAREAYYTAARNYAFCLDDVWGQDEF